MKGLREKFRKHEGFTLIEMLIVVAIIAILIAIAIPMVNKALEQAREATDQANERSALGLAYVDVMADPKNSVLLATSNTSHVAYYVVSNNKGELKPAGTGATGYGKGTTAGDIDADNVNKIIKVTYHPEKDTNTDPKFEAGDVTAEWVEVPT